MEDAGWLRLTVMLAVPAPSETVELEVARLMLGLGESLSAIVIVITGLVPGEVPAADPSVRTMVSLDSIAVSFTIV